MSGDGACAAELGPCAADVVELDAEVGETESRVDSVGAFDDGGIPALEGCRDAAEA